jgi:hypothetical protein
MPQPKYELSMRHFIGTLLWKFEWNRLQQRPFKPAKELKPENAGRNARKALIDPRWHFVLPYYKPAGDHAERLFAWTTEHPDSDLAAAIAPKDCPDSPKAAAAIGVLVGSWLAEHPFPARDGGVWVEVPIGEKIDPDVVCIESRYVHSNGYNSSTLEFTLREPDTGALLTWMTEVKPELEVGQAYRLVGKIKDQRVESNGTRLTVMTRCKATPIELDTTNAV